MYALSIDTIRSYENRETVLGWEVRSRCAAYSPEKDSELILTLKMETRHPIFFARRCASTVYAVVVCMFVCPSVHHTLVLFQNG